ncbi:outer membrane protein assembly factor BamD [Bacteroidales bacterium OttesenSCG-928-J16]|nr:outer membrane protein assembly factor BamD [Bacteroidales bacterium OttesenSCG-928-J16]
MFKRRLIFLFVIVCLTFTSCSKHQKLVKSSDNELKYEAAIAYFNKKDYFRALQLFDQLTTAFRGTSRGERINYYQAYCYYEQGDWTLGGYYFQRFAKNYPNSRDAEEALFMSALCKYNLSPRYSLDQTTTQEAIAEFQAFLNRYPSTTRKEECNQYIDELRDKLAKKDLEAAKLYFNMEEFDAAVVSFENVIKTYPSSDYVEEASYYIMRSYYRFALNSIREKQLERFQKAFNAYTDFVAFYPESSYRKDAEKMKDITLTQIEKLQK